MSNKIVFGNNELPVTNAYAFRYPNGKVVLRVECDDTVTSEAPMKLLKDNEDDILYYEYNEDTEQYELKMTYEGYTTHDYTSSYNGTYSCEIRQADAVTEQVAMNTADIEYLMLLAE